MKLTFEKRSKQYVMKFRKNLKKISNFIKKISTFTHFNPFLNKVEIKPLKCHKRRHHYIHTRHNNIAPAMPDFVRFRCICVSNYIIAFPEKWFLFI